MRSKNEMYINNNFSNNRKNYLKRNRHRRGNRKIGFYVVLVLIIVIILGLAAFYITSEAQKEKELSEIPQKQIELESVDVVKETNKNVASDSGNEASQSGTADQGGTTNQSDTADQSGTADQVGGIDYEENKVIDLNKEDIRATDSVVPRTPVKVKGIYVSGARAGTESYMEELIQLVDTTEINAMVIDIKNDSGEVTYKMDLPAVQEMNADYNYIRDIKQLITALKAKDIYLIARIVAFKDPILAEGKPELSLRNTDGTIFRDKSGLSWVNPYKTEVWEYLVAVAEEAAQLGFDEIQFDYIRFSTDSGMKNVNFGEEAQNKSKIDIITEFTKYVSEKLKPLGVYVSADVYGAIIGSEVDANIVGQSYIEMTKHLDYICPMIYPSHYADGSYGIEHPDLEPYNLILKALNESESELTVIDKNSNNKAVVRPWLQDFTAKWLTNYKSYGPDEIRDQIQAVYDAGYEEWILWNGSNNYTKEGLLEQ